ncbi:MAG: single-stranded DNA-binding protein [Caldilinea sp.]|mgnify:CR=1 FL=1
MYQQITLIGNLGRDPEMRYTPSGVPVTNFSVAVSRRWTGQDGQPQEKTLWFRVVAWNKLAETTSQYLTKGSKVLVVGEMEEPTAYIDREGQPRASLEVRALTVKFLSARGDVVESHVGAGGATVAEAGPGMSDEDIPF